jgi:Winged helix DNA-binding domain
MPSLTSEIVHRRLLAQRISGGTFGEPGAVVAWLGAVQAQDYGAALWAIGLRTTGAREPDVERAIADRRIVRTWPMQGTLDAAASRLVIAGGMFKPVIVAGNRILGTWKRRAGRGEVVCSIAPFARLSAATVRASFAALARYARFVGLDLREGTTSPA